MKFNEFKKYYLEFTPLVKKSFPEIRKYVVNFALQRGKETPYDAITEIYWDDFDTIVRTVKSDTYKDVILPYEKEFIELKELKVVLTEEYRQK